MPSWTSTWISSRTSRTAHSGVVSPASILPLGQDQSLYRGRWISRTCSLWLRTRQQSAPAAVTVMGPGIAGAPAIACVEACSIACLAAQGGALARPGGQQPGLHVAERAAVVVHVVAGPDAPVVQLPAGSSRVHIAVHQGDELGDVVAVAQLHECLDAAVQVPVHHVRRADEDCRLP